MIILTITTLLIIIFLFSCNIVNGRNCDDSKEWEKYYKKYSNNSFDNNKSLLFNLSKFTGRLG